MNRRLSRCRDNRVLAGVAAGVAEFFDLDPTLVRVLWFISIFFGGFTLVLYIGLAIIMPLEPLPAGAPAGVGTAGNGPAAGVGPAAGTAPDGAAVEGTVASAWASEPIEHRHRAHGTGRWTTLVGFALILFGTLAFLDRFLPGLDLEHFIVPAFAIGIGIFLVVTAVRREQTET